MVVGKVEQLTQTESGMDMKRLANHLEIPHAKQRANVEVEGSPVKIRTSVALELAIRQGAEDSLQDIAEVLGASPLALGKLGPQITSQLVDAITEAVTSAVAELMVFNDGE